MYATKSDLSEHCKTFNELLLPRLNECVNNFIYPTLSQKTIDDYTTESKTSKLTIVNERLQAIEQEIEKTYAIAIQSEEKNIELANKMDYYATQYKYTAETYTNMVEYNLLYNAFKTTSINDELDLKHLSNQSQYNTASLKITYDYLFTNNKFVSDFAKPLTIGVASNNELNAYDYSYFVLKLFSFIVITYAILSACNTIAGENKDGTLRYFAIKPVSRYEIFFGKLFAIMLMSVILILFSTIISLLVGGTVYGFNTNTILTIFNGTTAITIHPISMLSIYLISLLIEITIYVSITMLLSTIIKSDLFAITIILVVYLINILLPLFVQGANNWLAFYPFSHISFYPLFGSAVYLQTNNFFSLLLGSKVYTTTNLGLIICVIILLISILNIVACKLFKNKEI